MCALQSFFIIYSLFRVVLLLCTASYINNNITAFLLHVQAQHMHEQQQHQQQKQPERKKNIKRVFTKNKKKNERMKMKTSPIKSQSHLVGFFLLSLCLPK